MKSLPPEVRKSQTFGTGGGGALGHYAKRNHGTLGARLR